MQANTINGRLICAASTIYINAGPHRIDLSDARSSTSSKVFKYITVCVGRVVCIVCVVFFSGLVQRDVDFER